MSSFNEKSVDPPFDVDQFQEFLLESAKDIGLDGGLSGEVQEELLNLAQQFVTDSDISLLVPEQEHSHESSKENLFIFSDLCRKEKERHSEFRDNEERGRNLAGTGREEASNNTLQYMSPNSEKSSHWTQKNIQEHNGQQKKSKDNLKETDILGIEKDNQDSDKFSTWNQWIGSGSQNIQRKEYENRQILEKFRTWFHWRVHKSEAENLKECVDDIDETDSLADKFPFKPCYGMSKIIFNEFRKKYLTLEKVPYVGSVIPGEYFVKYFLASTKCTGVPGCIHDFLLEKDASASAAHLKVGQFSWTRYKRHILLNRISVVCAPIPEKYLKEFRNRDVLYHFVLRMIFQSTQSVLHELNATTAKITLLWKASITLMFNCFEAFQYLNFAATFVLNNIITASKWYKIALTALLIKLMKDFNKQKSPQISYRLLSSKIKHSPIVLRKCHRKTTKICKLKPVWINYIFNYKSIIKKTYHFYDNILISNFITKLAFLDSRNLYPKKYRPPEYIASQINLSDEIDIDFIKKYTKNQNIYLNYNMLRPMKSEDLNLRHLIRFYHFCCHIIGSSPVDKFKCSLLQCKFNQSCRSYPDEVFDEKFGPKKKFSEEDLKALILKNEFPDLFHIIFHIIYTCSKDFDRSESLLDILRKCTRFDFEYDTCNIPLDPDIFDRPVNTVKDDVPDPFNFDTKREECKICIKFDETSKGLFSESAPEAQKRKDTVNKTIERRVLEHEKLLGQNEINEKIGHDISKRKYISVDIPFDRVLQRKVTDHIDEFFTRKRKFKKANIKTQNRSPEQNTYLEKERDWLENHGRVLGLFNDDQSYAQEQYNYAFLAI